MLKVLGIRPDLSIAGAFDPREYSFEAAVRRCSPGSWKMTITQEEYTRLGDVVAIVVVGPYGDLFSGPITKINSDLSRENVVPLLELEGVGDNQLIFDYVVTPRNQFKYESKRGRADRVIGSILNHHVTRRAAGGERLRGLWLDIQGSRATARDNPAFLPFVFIPKVTFDESPVGLVMRWLAGLHNVTWDVVYDSSVRMRRFKLWPNRTEPFVILTATSPEVAKLDVEWRAPQLTQARRIFERQNGTRVFRTSNTQLLPQFNSGQVRTIGERFGKSTMMRKIDYDNRRKIDRNIGRDPEFYADHGVLVRAELKPAPFSGLAQQLLQRSQMGDMVRVVTEAQDVDVRLIGWDIAIGEDGPQLVALLGEDQEELISSYRPPELRYGPDTPNPRGNQLSWTDPLNVPMPPDNTDPGWRVSNRQTPEQVSSFIPSYDWAPIPQWDYSRIAALNTLSNQPGTSHGLQTDQRTVGGEIREIYQVSSVLWNVVAAGGGVITMSATDVSPGALTDYADPNQAGKVEFAAGVVVNQSLSNLPPGWSLDGQAYGRTFYVNPLTSWRSGRNVSVFDVPGLGDLGSYLSMAIQRTGNTIQVTVTNQTASNPALPGVEVLRMDLNNNFISQNTLWNESLVSGPGYQVGAQGDVSVYSFDVGALVGGVNASRIILMTPRMLIGWDLATIATTPTVPTVVGAAEPWTSESAPVYVLPGIVDPALLGVTTNDLDPSVQVLGANSNFGGVNGTLTITDNGPYINIQPNLANGETHVTLVCNSLGQGWYQHVKVV